MDNQEIKNITIALKDSLGPTEIREVVRRINSATPVQKIDKVVRNVLQSSKQVKLSAMENAELIDILSTSFSLFKEDEWTQERFLGEGSYGTVEMMYRESDRIAVKKFNEPDISTDIIHEFGCYAILTATKPSVYRDVVVGINFDVNISIALKLADGTLDDYANSLTNLEKVKQFPNVVDKCLECLSYIHACGIIHCDIKPTNTLVWWENNVATRIILSDFGLSTSVPNDIFYTPGYKAPEITKTGKATKETDVWALSKTLMQFFDADPTYFESSSKRNLVKSMATKDPAKRYKLEEPILVFPKRNWKIKSEISVGKYKALFIWMVDVLERWRIPQFHIIYAMDILCRFGNNYSMTSTNLKGYGIMSMIISLEWSGNWQGNYSFPVRITDKVYTEAEVRQFQLDILRELHGLIYLPGLKTYEEILKKNSYDQVKDFIENKFIDDHNQVFNELKIWR